MTRGQKSRVRTLRIHSRILLTIMFSAAQSGQPGQQSSTSVLCKNAVASKHTNRELDTAETPFISNLFNISLAAIADKAQPESQASPNTPESEPEFLQRSLEVLFSEETGRIIRSFETVINSTVALGTAFNDALESASSDSVSSDNTSFSPLLKKVATFVATARDDLRARFPLPATAPGHAEREKHVSAALEHLQQFVTRLARNHKIEQEAVERHLTHVTPLLHDMGVLIGERDLYVVEFNVLIRHLHRRRGRALPFSYRSHRAAL